MNDLGIIQVLFSHCNPFVVIHVISRPSLINATNVCRCTHIHLQLGFLLSSLQIYDLLVTITLSFLTLGYTKTIVV
jgi:hypothetical protein